jgi:hypothetical protein
VLDLVLENGRLVDETGNSWFLGEVGIEDGTIVEVGRVGRISHRLGRLSRSGREASPSTLRHLPARPRQVREREEVALPRGAYQEDALFPVERSDRSSLTPG